MVSKTGMAACAGILVLASYATASAQRLEEREPRDGACFYEDTNYRGRYFCVEANENVDSMPSGANDRVSSIRVFGGASVRVYRDTRFRGDSLRIDSNVRDLEREDFDDSISSFRIEGRSSGARGRGRPPFGSASPESIIRRAYQDILEREPDPSGMRAYRSRIIDDGWTEQDVREDLRRSEEYREKTTMTRAKAEDIVRRAYLAVLNREPDSGSAGYVNNVLRNGWTQQDVERELRRSPEYRRRNR